MIFVSEEKENNKSVFIRTVTNEEGKVILKKRVTISLFSIKKDDYTFFILYDEKMLPISSVFQFLNDFMRDRPLTSRNTSAFALRLLFCFISLNNLSLNALDEKAVRMLLVFLLGYSSNPEQYSRITLRKRETVNAYLAVYRSFFLFMNIKCDALFRAHTVSAYNSLERDYSNKIRFDNNLSIKNKSTTIPKYISPADFRMIFKNVLAENDKQAQIILHLMYGYGLRLGEVLGLTLEDIHEMRDNGKIIPVAILRNRLTDHKFQFAKGLPHVVDQRQYASKDYQQAAQIIVLSYNLYDVLIDYINDFHSSVIGKYPENYKASRADTVSDNGDVEFNHYIFLNKYGRILSDQVWNKHLRYYFVKSNIPLDLDVRENNLSHRFRHGFAMFHAKYSTHPVGVLELQKMLRHKSVQSTLVYYNPTPEDEFEIKMDFQKELYELIPELGKGITD